MFNKVQKDLLTELVKKERIRLENVIRKIHGLTYDDIKNLEYEIKLCDKTLDVLKGGK
tara:strand:- start:195 stop:368 length:174 start_codon:yes stop_codon:yes gene_type:complete